LANTWEIGSVYREEIMRRAKIHFAMIGIAIGLIAPGKAASADPGTLPPGQLPTFTALWWEWALSVPTPVNPTLDTTGADCMVGQRDFVWFLSGVNGGGSATRTCSVPADKTLFFPVINSLFFNTPNCAPQGPENLTVKFMRALVKPFIDAVQNLSVTVDCEDVKKTLLRRVQSDPFVTAVPADNIFGPAGCETGPLPAGVYSPSVDDGFYVSLSPLSPGPHTVHFHADSGSFTEDVTYDLTIVPVLLK
jgi:hypothetical protein